MRTAPASSAAARPAFGGRRRGAADDPQRVQLVAGRRDELELGPLAADEA